MNAFPLRPREVFDDLTKVVVGQDEAIREIASLLLIGPSSSSKAIPSVVRIHARIPTKGKEYAHRDTNKQRTGDDSKGRS